MSNIGCELSGVIHKIERRLERFRRLVELNAPEAILDRESEMIAAAAIELMAAYERDEEASVKSGVP